MQLRSSKPISRYERQRRKRSREQLLATPIAFVPVIAIVLTAEYENPLILLAAAILLMGFFLLGGGDE